MKKREGLVATGESKRARTRCFHLKCCNDDRNEQRTLAEEESSCKSTLSRELWRIRILAEPSKSKSFDAGSKVSVGTTLDLPPPALSLVLCDELGLVAHSVCL
ncbi:hypothetical protein MUK42_14686 [Musa troglodytarum]|uniref:Uncharacterized protein n=1 Tax=Musa troglodytarum TaxID=320322 RepID=A0A9E7L7V4_9LILI|nr:hypothetical protein MUK42_14686 [Musa troglodytarum]